MRNNRRGYLVTTDNKEFHGSTAILDRIERKGWKIERVILLAGDNFWHRANGRAFQKVRWFDAVTGSIMAWK